MTTTDPISSSLAAIRSIYAAVMRQKKQALDQRAETKPIDYLLDAKGRQCPLDIIGTVDLARHELTAKQIKRARELSEAIAAFKTEAFAEIDAFIEVSNSAHGAKIGISEKGKKTWKGNIQLINHDATQKINLRIHDRIAFNEKLNAALEKLNRLIKEHSGNVDEIIQVLINDAFKMDQAGTVDVKKILDLRRHKIKHPIWVSAMQDIADSIQVIGSKSYLQFWYRETPEAEWVSIPLDIARL
jgi:hypothetical protein